MADNFLRDMLARFQIEVDRSQLRAAKVELQATIPLAQNVKSALAGVGGAIAENPSVRRLQLDLERAQTAAEKLREKVRLSGEGQVGTASEGLQGVAPGVLREVEAVRSRLRELQASGASDNPQLLAVAERAQRAEQLVGKLTDRMKGLEAVTSAARAQKIDGLSEQLAKAEAGVLRLRASLGELKASGAKKADADVVELKAKLEAAKQSALELRASLATVKSEPVHNPHVAVLQTRIEQVKTSAVAARAELQRISTANTQATQAEMAQLSERMRELTQASKMTAQQINTTSATMRADAKAVEAGLRAQAKAAKDSEKALRDQARAADAALSPTQKLMKALDDSRAAGVGLFAELGRIRRIFGLLQFGAAIIGLQHFVQGAFTAAGALKDTSDALNVSTDALQMWNAFAAQAGATNQDVIITFRALAKNAADAARGAKGQAAAFKALGVEVKDSVSGELRPLSELLVEVGSKLGPMENATEKLALAQQTLGRSAIKLLPGFKGGTEEFKKQMEQLRELAIVYDKEFIKSADQAGDEMYLFGLQLQKIRALLIGFFLPALNSVMMPLTRFVSQMVDVARISEIVKGVFITLGAHGVGWLMMKFGNFLRMLGGAGGILRGLAILARRFILPFLIIDDILVFLQNGNSLLGKILDKLGGIGTKEKVVASLKAAWDALTASISLAFDALDGEISDENLQKFLKATQPIADFFEKDLPEAWEVFKRDLENIDPVEVDGEVVLQPVGKMPSFDEAIAQWKVDFLALGEDIGNILSAAWDYALALMTGRWIDALSVWLEAFGVTQGSLMESIGAVADWLGTKFTEQVDVALAAVARLKAGLLEFLGLGSGVAQRGLGSAFTNAANATTTATNASLASAGTSRAFTFIDQSRVAVEVKASPSDTSPTGLSNLISQTASKVGNMNKSKAKTMAKAY